MITGIGLAYQDLEGAATENFDAGPTEDPEDENVAMDPDENLPWPDPALVEQWWQKNRSLFSKGTRYLCGKPIAADWLKQVLRDGFQRHRSAAALGTGHLQTRQTVVQRKSPRFPPNRNSRQTRTGHSITSQCARESSSALIVFRILRMDGKYIPVFPL